ncbi:MAG: hypothetical protein IH628_15410 [Proteobacteria bacterium]|nr:hypothetical protein [Pseudomonadota bacterium]
MLQRLLLGRSEWSEADLGSEGLDGIQFINGRIGKASDRGLQEWTRLLLEGKRIVAVAGTDAHGNFNRFRQQGIPFLTIQEHHHQLFGQMMTGVFLDSDMTEKPILNALKQGTSVLTNGPVCTLRASNASGQSAGIGQHLSAGSIQLEIDAHSTTDFGQLESLDIICGTTGDVAEVAVLHKVSLDGYELNLAISLDHLQPGYVRGTLITSAKNPYTGQPHFCITNPIWIDSHRRQA